MLFRIEGNQVIIDVYSMSCRITKERCFECKNGTALIAIMAVGAFFISFLSQDWFLNRFPRTALKTERYFCCSEARQVIQ